jgi:hypothetical protein
MYVEPEFRGPVENLIKDFLSFNPERANLMMQPKGAISFQVKGIKKPKTASQLRAATAPGRLLRSCRCAIAERANAPAATGESVCRVVLVSSHDALVRRRHARLVMVEHEQPDR